MKFKKYSEIENTYRTKTIDFIREHGYDDKSYQWVVTEKVDGSNLSFWVSDSEIKAARRTGFLEPDENFYNYQTVLNCYKQIFTLEKHLYYGDCEYIIIYGELFGGSYNHPNVPRDTDAKKVQNRIQYCPSNDFYPFDVYTVSDDYTGYVPHRELEAIFNHSPIPYAKALFRGTFDECLAYDINFPTTIPDFYRLPPIEGNNAEGVVIKPEFPLYFRTGDRAILKNKIEDFSEIKQPRDKLPEVLPPEVNEAIEIINKYVTESRYYSVISKLGEVTIKDFGDVMKEYTTDVMSDFNKDFPAYMEFPKDMQKKVTKALGKTAASLIRRFL